MNPKARQFSFQLQLRSENVAQQSAAVNQMLETVKRQGGRVTGVSSGQEDSLKYTNVNVDADDPIVFWASMKRFIAGCNPILSRETIIVVCEGINGWNDFRLLYHFDKSEKIDNIK